ncbi:hypothetical protein [Actinoplanes sp. NPDC049599]|uniref:hypothetical protein n=1 Tax=Actinoplanes sp. NPDC049599 TaxID=3363903 RepID=UPI00379BA512
MNTIDELREVLEHRAGVPDPTGIIEAARARATHVRRRRRLTAVALAAVVAGAIPVTVAQLRTPDPLPAAPPPYREPGEATLTVRPAPGFFVLRRQIHATGQDVVVRNLDSSDRRDGGSVTAFDPGTYDPAWLKTGERITVGGHPAYYTLTVTSRPSGPATDPAGREAIERSRLLESEGVAVIGWPDPSGAWVVVSGARSREDLRQLAESVRMGPPRKVTSPVQFGWLPDGLRLDYVTADDEPAGPRSVASSARVGFTAEASPTPLQPGSWAEYRDRDTALAAVVQPKNSRGWGEMVGGPGGPSVLSSVPRWQTIGGHRTWYLPEGNPDFAVDSGAHMLVETEKCGVLITLGEPVKISYADLIRTVTQMTVADCTDSATWTPPLK